MNTKRLEEIKKLIDRSINELENNDLITCLESLDKALVKIENVQKAIEGQRQTDFWASEPTD